MITTRAGHIRAADPGFQKAFNLSTYKMYNFPIHMIFRDCNCPQISEYTIIVPQAPVHDGKIDVLCCHQVVDRDIKTTTMLKLVFSQYSHHKPAVLKSSIFKDLRGFPRYNIFHRARNDDFILTIIKLSRPIRAARRK